MPSTNDILPASFRDPSGCLFQQGDALYRRVNRNYRGHYERLVSSGLYQQLVDGGLLIPHQEVDPTLAGDPDVYTVLQPELIPFVSYPYEWCFSQLKDAALLTLRLQQLCLEREMSLKDASAYNVQFRDGKPIFIDTLSFEKYREGEPWVAYRQFCQHFLAPLALMHHRDVRLSQLLRVYIDGIPLDLASKLLPFRTLCNFALATHIHGHARFQRHNHDQQTRPADKSRMSKFSLQALINHLEMTVNSLHWTPGDTPWSDYYEETNYSTEAFQHKKQLVAKFLQAARPRTVWDLGANNGVFSRIAAAQGIFTISADFDEAAVEANYLQCRQQDEHRMLPLVLDLLNPSASIGWSNTERMSFLERGPADSVLALALIHHLALANNLPFAHIAGFFARLCRTLIIEFVPREDSQVQRLLATREDIFPHYTQDEFERAFAACFTIRSAVHIEGSARTLYLMERK